MQQFIHLCIRDANARGCLFTAAPGHDKIVAARWARPTLRGLRIILVAIIVGTIIVRTIFEGVIVLFFFEAGS